MTMSLDGGVEGAEPVDGREGVAEPPGQDRLVGGVKELDADLAVHRRVAVARLLPPVPEVEVGGEAAVQDEVGVARQPGLLARLGGLVVAGAVGDLVEERHREVHAGDRGVVPRAEVDEEVRALEGRVSERPCLGWHRRPRDSLTAGHFWPPWDESPDRGRGAAPWPKSVRSGCTTGRRPGARTPFALSRESANNGVSTLTMRVTIQASQGEVRGTRRREPRKPVRPSRAPAGHRLRFAWEEPPEWPRSSLSMKRLAAVSSGE